MIPINGYENYTIDVCGTVINTRTNRVLKPSINENGYLYVSLWKNNKSVSKTVHRLVAEAYIPNPDNKPFVNHLDANRSNPHKNNLEWCDQSENIKHAYRLGTMTQKQHFTREETEWLLTEFLAGTQTMTALAQRMGVGLSRMTINLRNHAHRTNRLLPFEALLKQQKDHRNRLANANKQRPIVQLNQDGQVLASFPSLTAATRALGKASSGTISNALNPNHPQQKAYGFLWKYA